MKPNILVKGADYTKEQVIGGKFVESYGGQIKLVKLTKGKSTSNIIDKISSWVMSILNTLKLHLEILG